MNHGLATIVNAHGSMAELPADAVRVIPDAFEQGQLVEALEDLRRDAPGRRALGEKARELIARDHAPERCARMARDAIEQFAERGRRREAELRSVIERLGSDPGDEAVRLDLAERLVIGSRSPFRLPQLLLDVTETARTDRRTGIERVARALALALIESPPEGYRVEPVVLSHAGGRWHYRAACAFSAGVLGVPSPLADRPIDISRGDRLLGLDISGETFVRASDDGLFDRLRDGGVDCRMMVFDLLPVLRPECFPPGADQSFGAWLERVARLDGAVCISGTVAGSLRAWLRDQHAERARAFSIESFPLGADVAAAAPTRGLPHDAEALLARLAAEPTVLMVGTLEPRKRHLQALEAFSLLWQRRRRVNLVIVGRAGWQHLPPAEQRDIPELLHVLRAHPESGRRLLWLDGVSDEYLDRVYAAASGLLAASIDEGFGLPLIEAAVKGLPVLARDISVFREVAGESARYFRAETGAQLAEAVEAWISAGFEPRPSPGIALMTWKRSAGELARVMLAPRTQVEVGCAADPRSD
jgi:glycosyltransferase involved in cell wall biosynthesis